MAKGAKAFSKSNLMVTKKVGQISENWKRSGRKSETGGSAQSQLGQERYINLKPWWVIKNGKELLRSVLCCRRCRLSPRPCQVATHTGFTGNGAAGVGDVQPSGESSVQQPELEQRAQDVYFTKSADTNRIKKRGRVSCIIPPKLHQTTLKPKFLAKSVTSIVTEETHPQWLQTAVFFDSSPHHSDHIHLQICLCVFLINKFAFWVCFFLVKRTVLWLSSRYCM